MTYKVINYTKAYRMRTSSKHVGLTLAMSRP